MTAGHDAVKLVIPADDSLSPRAVARWLRECLERWPAEDAALVGVVVGEIVDNAWRHALPPYVVELSLDRRQELLRITVRDCGPHVRGGWWYGAGLLLVEGLSADWGVVREAEGTTVWADLRFED